MTKEGRTVMVVTGNHGLGLTPEQAEQVAARILEEGLKVTLLTILEIIAILWVAS